MRESRRQLLRALVAVLCLLGAAWTCTAMLQPRRVDVEPGSYAGIAEDQSGQSLDLGIVFGS